jgi:hypothetical protein
MPYFVMFLAIVSLGTAIFIEEVAFGLTLLFLTIVLYMAHMATVYLNEQEETQ